MTRNHIAILFTAAGLLMLAVACSKQQPENTAAQKPAAQAQQQTQQQGKQGQDVETPVGMDAVPAAVTEAFKKAYPSAAIKGASKETENGQAYYEIESVDGMKHRDVSYYPDGTVAAVEETIQVSEVPGAVIAAVQKKYPDATVRRMERVTEGGKVTYQLVVENEKESREVVLGKDGSILHEEVSAAPSDNDEEGKD